MAAFARGIDEMLCPAERALDAQSDVFDPWRAPTRFLPWLAYVTGARTEASWDERRTRAAIDHAGYLSTRRGTPGALLYESLEVYGWQMEITDPGGARLVGADWPVDGPLRVTLRTDVLNPDPDTYVNVDAVQEQLERLVEAHVPAHLLYEVAAAFSVHVSNPGVWNVVQVSVTDAEPETGFTVEYDVGAGGTVAFETDGYGAGTAGAYVYAGDTTNGSHTIAVYPTEHPELKQCVLGQTLPLRIGEISPDGKSVTVCDIDPAGEDVEVTFFNGSDVLAEETIAVEDVESGYCGVAETLVSGTVTKVQALQGGRVARHVLSE
ncbi:phage tail protein [Streptomyces goshikiensis]